VWVEVIFVVLVAEMKPPSTDVYNVVSKVRVSVNLEIISDVETDERVTILFGIDEVVPHTASPLPFVTASAVIIRMVEYTQNGVGEALLNSD